jgi:hypothetical protein
LDRLSLKNVKVFEPFEFFKRFKLVLTSRRSGLCWGPFFADAVGAHHRPPPPLQSAERRRHHRASPPELPRHRRASWVSSSPITMPGKLREAPRCQLCASSSTGWPRRHSRLGHGDRPRARRALRSVGLVRVPFGLWARRPDLAHHCAANFLFFRFF